MSANTDAKLFQRTKLHELRSDLISEKKDKGWVRKKTTLKKIIANATMGNDMSGLFVEVVESCMGIQVLEIKKMVCELSCITPLYHICRRCKAKYVFPRIFQQTST